MSVLDHKMIMRYKVWNSGENHLRGLGFILPQQAPNPTVSGSYLAVPRHVVSEEVQHEVDGWFYNIEAQNVRLAQRQDTIFAYNV